LLRHARCVSEWARAISYCARKRDRRAELQKGCGFHGHLRGFAGLSSRFAALAIYVAHFLSQAWPRLLFCRPSPQRIAAAGLLLLLVRHRLEGHRTLRAKSA